MQTTESVNTAHSQPGASILTDRLILTPVALEDVHLVLEMRKAKEVWQWSSMGEWTSIDHAEAWIRKCLENPESHTYLIEERQSVALVNDAIGSETSIPVRRVAGSIGLPRPGEMGYQLAPDFWGKGYATEAAAAFLIELFTKLMPNLPLIEAWVDTGNVASSKVLKKVGFGKGDADIVEVDTPLMGGIRAHQQYVITREDVVVGLDSRQSLDV